MSNVISQRIYNVALTRFVGKANAEILAKCMVAQAKHESGNYTSKFFKLYNNAFGYSYVKGAKWQLPAGGTKADNNQPIAAYASIENSAEEVAAWLLRRWASFSKVKNVTDYAIALKANGYYGDTLVNYLRGLKAFYSSFVPSAITNAVAGLKAKPLLPIIAVGFFLFFF